MNTSYKELNNGIARKEGISNHKHKAVSNTSTTIKRDDPRIQNKINREQEQNHGIE
jgi:hypothetical protein